MLGLGSVEGSIAIAGIQAAVAEVPKGCAMQLVRTALGDGVNHPSGGASKFGHVRSRQDLELLNGVLRYLRADAIPAGRVPVKLVGGVISVRKEGIATG